MEDSKASIKGYLASGKYPITGIKIFRFEVMVRVLVWELQVLQKILISIIKMKMNDSVQCTVKIQSEIAVMAKRRNVISYAINQLIIH